MYYQIIMKVLNTVTCLFLMSPLQNFLLSFDIWVRINIKIQIRNYRSFLLVLFWVRRKEIGKNAIHGFGIMHTTCFSWCQLPHHGFIAFASWVVVELIFKVPLASTFAASNFLSENLPRSLNVDTRNSVSGVRAWIHFVQRLHGKHWPFNVEISSFHRCVARGGRFCLIGISSTVT